MSCCDVSVFPQHSQEVCLSNMPQYQQPAGVIHSVLKTDGGEAHRDACAGKHRPQQGADARRELSDARSKNVCLPEEFQACNCFTLTPGNLIPCRFQLLLEHSDPHFGTPNCMESHSETFTGEGCQHQLRETGPVTKSSCHIRRGFLLLSLGTLQGWSRPCAQLLTAEQLCMNQTRCNS